MADPEELKTILRSILISTPQDTTIEQLWKEYKTNEGRDFPFHALGYRSFWEYLKSIPDVVKLEQVPCGSVVVRPVASEKSAHIEKLVMKQKISVPTRGNRKRGNTRRRRAAVTKLPNRAVKNIPSLPSSQSLSPAITPDVRHFESSYGNGNVDMNHEAYNSCESLSIRLDQVPYAYDDGSAETISRRVFLRNGVEKTVDELSEEISFLNATSQNNHIASSSGVHGLDVFSSGCSKLWTSGIASPVVPANDYNRVQVVQRYSESLGAAEVHECMSEHTRIVKEIRHRKYETFVITIKIRSESGHDEAYSKIIIPDEVVNKLLRLLENSYEGMRIRDIGRRLVLSQKTIDRLCDLNINSVDDIVKNLNDCVDVIGDKVFQKIVVSAVSNGVNHVPCGSDYEYNRSDSSRLSDRNSACSGNSLYLISGGVLKNIRQLLQENPRGVLCDDLPQMYYDKYRTTLDPNDFGFNSVLDMASHLQHQTNEFILKRDINRNAWVLTSLRDVDIPASLSVDVNFQACSLETGFVINNFKKILMKYQPMTSNDLLMKYNMSYGRENGIYTLGYGNIEEFIKSNLKDIVDITTAKSTQYVSLKSDFLLPTALPEAQEIDDIMYNKDVCLIDDKLPPFAITFSCNLPTKVEFVVSDVTNPDCFSMQLVSSYKVLDKLMTELYYFYEENEANYTMCEEVITIDMLCACTFGADDDWHRARIMAVSSDTVLLDYVDYGTTYNQPKSKLRLLHKKFSKLPVQSIGAKLRGIRPAGNTLQWSNDVRYKLLQMFDNSIVVAEVFSIDSKRSFLEVSLIQVSPQGEETLFSDILVKLGLAEYTDLPDVDELDHLIRTVSTKRVTRGSLKTQRSARHSESSNKYSTGDEPTAAATESDVKSQGQRESAQNSFGSVNPGEILDRTTEQLENCLRNEEPPKTTNCPRPPPGFDNINRTQNFQNLLSTGYLAGLTQLQQVMTGSLLFNLEGMLNDMTPPIIPDESLLLGQALSDCGICKMVCTRKDISMELLIPLVQHNIRHAQVFCNTLRQNLILKMNPAANMFFNGATSVGNLSMPGAQNSSINPSILCLSTLPQTVKSTLPNSSSVLSNSILQSLINFSISDPTSILNSVHLLNPSNTSVGVTNAVALPSTNSIVSEISIAVEPSTSNRACLLNTSAELTNLIPSQLDSMKVLESRDAVITSDIGTQLSSQPVNTDVAHNVLRSEINKTMISESSGSGGVNVSKPLNNYMEPVTETFVQLVSQKPDNINKQNLSESVIIGTTTSVYTPGKPEGGHGTVTSSDKFTCVDVNTAPNKSGTSADPQISISQSVGPDVPDIYDTFTTSVPTSSNVLNPPLGSSTKQRTVKPASQGSPDTIERLIETDKTVVNCSKHRVTNEYHRHTVDHPQNVCVSYTSHINKERHEYSENDRQFSASQSLSSVCRNSYVSENSHSSAATSLENLTEPVVDSENCPGYVKTESLAGNTRSRIPGTSFSKTFPKWAGTRLQM